MVIDRFGPDPDPGIHPTARIAAATRFVMLVCMSAADFGFKCSCLLGKLQLRQRTIAIAQATGQKRPSVGQLMCSITVPITGMLRQLQGAGNLFYNLTLPYLN